MKYKVWNSIANKEKCFFIFLFTISPLTQIMPHSPLISLFMIHTSKTISPLSFHVSFFLLIT